MDLLLFHYFVVLTEYMNFSVAADELFLSQSSLSKRIRDLEQKLGVELFIRNTRSIRLTDAGEAILPYAKSIASEYDVMRKESQMQMNHRHEVLRLSVISFMAQYGIMELVTDFLHTSGYEEQNVSVIEIASHKGLELMEAGKVDFCIMYGKMLPVDQYNKYPLIMDRLVLAVNRRHRLAGRKRIRARDFKDENIAMISKGSEPFLYNYLLSECEKAGVYPNIWDYGVWLPTIESMIVRNECISILPGQVARHFKSLEIVAMPIEDIEPFWLSAITKKNYNSELFQTFIRYIKKEIKGKNWL